MWYRVGILDNVRLGGGGYNTTRVGIYIFGVRSITHSHILISKSTALTTRVLYIVSVCIDTTLHAPSPSKHNHTRTKLSLTHTLFLSPPVLYSTLISPITAHYTTAISLKSLPTPAKFPAYKPPLLTLGRS
jgi:hypothetical protein